MKLTPIHTMSTLVKLSDNGLITLHEDTGKKLVSHGGKKFTCTYIFDGGNTFEFAGRIYMTKFVSGCFYPYVFIVGETYAAYHKNGWFAFLVQPDNVEKINKEEYTIHWIN